MNTAKSLSLLLAPLFAVVATAVPNLEIPKDGLRLWLKAGEEFTTDQDKRVSGWADQSGKGNHVAQETVKRQPVLVSHVLNGHPVVRFDGAEPDDDFLYGQIGPLEGPITVFAVAKFNNPSQTFGTDFADYVWNIGEGCKNNVGVSATGRRKRGPSGSNQQAILEHE